MNKKILIGQRGAPYYPPAGFVFTQTISSNTTDYNLRTAAMTAGWNGTSLLTATITVAPGGVYLYPSSTTNYGFTVPDTIPIGSTLSLVIGAGSYVLGRGGSSSKTGLLGSGTTALYIRQNITITNNGTVAGGGGAGGYIQGGASGYYSGGGGGAPLGLGINPIGLGTNQPGNPGTLTTPGTGGGPNSITGQYGATGGGYGQNGETSSQGVAGCLHGKYLDGRAYVTWLVTETRKGGVS